MTFEELKIMPTILKALKEKNYHTPTPIQAKAIPHVLNRNDLLGCAQTGTGKTAAFALPIIQLIQKIEGKVEGKPTLRALITTPTRELAIQIGENVTTYAKYTKVQHTVIFGGVKQTKQVERIKKGVHLIVATPGRLIDLVDQGFVDLSTVKIFVLDEADRMLDMGFIHDIRKLLKWLPAKRQSLFFSATMPNNIIKLSNTILKNPKSISVTPRSTAAETVKQFVYYTNKNSKSNLLLHILKKRQINQALLFARTKHGANKLVRKLTKENISCAAIHGDKAQTTRQKALNSFKEGNIKILVATDIAARGIDIEKLKYVINYNVSNMAETYVHRIGRSGRAGEEGTAISLCEPEENAYIKDIEKLIKKPLKVVSNHPFPQTETPMTAAEKKEWNKEKQRKKQAFFAARKKSRNSKK
jgi:ATP-dependent RNA helicase RhlE